MDITWLGHSCFRLRESNVVVVTDPYAKTLGYGLPARLRADIVTVSHDRPGHNNVAAVKDNPQILDSPGEYEIKGVFVTGIQSSHRRQKSEPTEPNTIFVFDFDGLNVCHLGDLGEIPSQVDVENVGEISVLLVPVGAGDTLDAARAAEVVSILEPRMVIPMHYSTPHTDLKLDTVDKFLKEMGVTEVQPQEMLRLTPRDLPDETQVILLEYKQG